MYKLSIKLSLFGGTNILYCTFWIFFLWGGGMRRRWKLGVDTFNVWLLHVFTIHFYNELEQANKLVIEADLIFLLSDN